MSRATGIGSKAARPTNARNRIHVEEFKADDYFVTAVYHDNRHWRHMRPRKSGASFWVERNSEGLFGPVSSADEKWLDSIWKRSEEFPKVLRFPRRDEECEKLITNLWTSQQDGDTELIQHYLSGIQKRITKPPYQYKPELADSQKWSSLPRFDPSKVERTQWLIKEFIAERNIQLVFGERGSFKSTLFLFAARAVASGEEFLGAKTQRRRVLYLDYENPANVIKARNDDLNLDLPNNPNLAIWDRSGNEGMPRPGDPRLRSIVIQCVAETGYGPWIIFDSWSSLLKPGEGGEHTGQTAPIYAELRELCDLGATITVLDHSRKYERDVVYGGADKEAKVDSIHNLQTTDNPHRPQNMVVRVESWLKRYAPKGAGVFAFEITSRKGKDGEWHVSDLILVADPVAEVIRQKRDLLRDLIRANPEAGQESLALLAAKKGLARDEAISLLKKGDGKYWTVQKSAHGKYTYRLRKP